MPDQTTLPVSSPIDHEAVNRALSLAARDALLEHARMGRCVHESHNGQIVTITPAEIFARYGFDEFGRPVTSTSQPH